MHLKGTLSLAGDASEPLRVEYRVEDGILSIVALDGSLIGRWAVREIRTEPTPTGAILHAEGERLIVTVPNPSLLHIGLGATSQPAVASRINDAREIDSTDRGQVQPSRRRRKIGLTAGLLILLVVLAGVATLVGAGIIKSSDATWADDTADIRMNIGQALSLLRNAETSGDLEAAVALCRSGIAGYGGTAADQLRSAPDPEVRRLMVNLTYSLETLFVDCANGRFVSDGTIEYLTYASGMLGAAEGRIAVLVGSDATTPLPVAERQPVSTIRAWALRMDPVTLGIIEYMNAIARAADTDALGDLQNACRNGGTNLEYWRSIALPAPDTILDRETRVALDAFGRASASCENLAPNYHSTLIAEFEVIGDSMSRLTQRVVELSR